HSGGVWKTLRLEELKPVVHALSRIGSRSGGLETGSQYHGIFEGLTAPLPEIGRHRVGRVAQQPHPPVTPGGQRWAIVDVVRQHSVVGRQLYQREDGRIPSLEEPEQRCFRAAAVGSVSVACWPSGKVRVATQ